jgi:muconate cycloisomerase
MKIESIETIPVALPRRRVHSWSGNTLPIGAYLIVRLRTDDGLVGFGEAPTLIQWGGDHGRYYGESQRTAAAVIEDHLAPAVLGADPGDAGGLHERMDRAVSGHPYAKAAIDLACFDVAGKAAGVPVTVLLGGPCRLDVPIAHSFGLQMTPDEVEEEAETVLSEGVRALKLKVGVDHARDLEAARRLRALDAEADISIDANRAWPDPDAAVREIASLDAHVLTSVEQPVEGAAAMASVAARVRPPIMADESAWTAQDVDELAAVGAARQISIYYSKPGGLHRARAVAARCAALGLRANVNGSAETGIGSAANLHLAASAPIIDLPSLIMVSAPRGSEPTRWAGRLYADDLIAEPLIYRDGRIRVPNGPGLGVTVDERKLEVYRVDR